MLKLYHYLFITAAICLLLGGGIWRWHLKTPQGAKTKNTKRRRSDGRKMSKVEKKAIKKAKQLKSRGHPAEAAQVLLAANLYREAVHTFEKADLIHEAAKVLFKMNRPERAAAVYTKHKYWHDAAKAFRKANLFREAAKSHEKAGDFEGAAEAFYKAGLFGESAAAALEAGNTQQAIKVYLASGNQEAAIGLMLDTVKVAGPEAMPPLNSYEQELITQHALHREISPELVTIIQQYGRSADVTAELLRYGDKEKAAFILRRLGKGLVSPIVQKLGDTSSACMTLADLLRELGLFEEAGATLEQINQYERAGEAFTMAGNHDRAKFCQNKAKEENYQTPIIAPAAAQTAVNPPPPPKAATTVANMAPPPPSPITIIKEAEPLKGISDRDLVALTTLGVETSYPAQETLFDSKLPPTGIIFVLDGSVSLFPTKKSNKIGPPAQARKGQILGLKWGLLDITEDFRTVTSEPTKVLIIPKAEMTAFLSSHLAVATLLYKHLCYELQNDIEFPHNFSSLNQAS